jgi:hypothetical protein
LEALFSFSSISSFKAASCEISPRVVFSELVLAFFGAFFNARGTEGCTLLLWSLFKDWRLVLNGQEKAHADEKIAMLKFLMSRGADIHALSTAKWTAMHLAVSNQLPIRVLDFIAHLPNIDLNAADVDMETPLIWCAMLDFPDHAQFLIKHGADIARRDKNGKTALDHARSEAMRQLLREAAKPR